jgi:PhoPQ-activated pathogenicity-related protein
MRADRHLSLVPRTLLVLAWLAVGAGLAFGQALPSTMRPAPAGHETALDRYVATPDAHFAFTRVKTTTDARGTVSVLQLTSQQWLSEREVEQPVWTHWLTIVRPARVTSDIALLFITGGAVGEPAPAGITPWLAAMATDTGTVVAELRMVAAQPVVFVDDPARKPRFEDDFIAYTWAHYLKTGDDRWPARLPMTKAAVRAMDAITAFCGSPDGGAVPVGRFVVAGASKRGWTTWTTAAVDRRVMAIAPIVIDVLNLEPSFVHHWQAYGRWSDAVQDYVDHDVMRWLGTPQFRALMAIEEPFSYRERLDLPKLLINAAGDEFFLPDSSQFYLDQLPGETHVRYVPNTGHGLDKSNAPETLHAFYAAIVSGRPRPSFTTTLDPDGAVRVVARDRPTRVRLWQATNPRARDFRVDHLGRRYRARDLTPVGPNTWLARVDPPRAGWTAWFVELTFPSGGRYPLVLTTPVRVSPDRMPFDPPPPPATGSN